MRSTTAVWQKYSEYVTRTLKGGGAQRCSYLSACGISDVSNAGTASSRIFLLLVLPVSTRGMSAVSTAYWQYFGRTHWRFSEYSQCEVLEMLGVYSKYMKNTGSILL